MGDFFEDLFGFDFNGDGKTDIGESWLAYKIFEELKKEEEEDDEDDEEDFNYGFDEDSEDDDF